VSCAVVQRLGDLTQVIAAGDAVGRGAHFLHGGDQQRNEDPMMR